MMIITVEPKNMARKVLTACMIAWKETGIRRNLDIVLNQAMVTASLITDSP